MHFSVLIYGEVEQNIDFNDHFNLMFLSDLFNFNGIYPRKIHPRNFYIMRRSFFILYLIVLYITDVVIQ